MKKYLKYLLSDIEALIEQAPALPTSGLSFMEEEETFSIPLRYVKIGELIGIQKEVFPPEHLLTDMQVILLVESLTDLWSAWLLHWTIPPNLPVRKHYMAMVSEIDGVPVAYRPEEGADVHICNLSAEKPCPFGDGEQPCHCRKMEESMQHEINLWEEYLRSSGLDPDQEITPEDEALFEKNLRSNREPGEPYADDSLSTELDFQTMMEKELTDEEQRDFLFALEMADELLGLILRNLADSDQDPQSEEDGDDLDFPF